METKQLGTAADSTQHCEQITAARPNLKRAFPTQSLLSSNSSNHENEPENGDVPLKQKPTISGVESDDGKSDASDSYLRRRMKNNESARKSREKRRQIDEELRRQLELVIAENQKLRSQLELMTMIYKKNTIGSSVVGSSDDIEFPHKLVTSSTNFQTWVESSSSPPSPLCAAEPHVTSAGAEISEKDCKRSSLNKKKVPTFAEIIRKTKPTGLGLADARQSLPKTTSANAMAVVSTTTPPAVSLPVRQVPGVNTVLLGGNSLGGSAAIPLVMFAPVEFVGLSNQLVSQPTSCSPMDQCSAGPLDLSSQGIDSRSTRADTEPINDVISQNKNLSSGPEHDRGSCGTVAVRTVKSEYNECDVV